MIAPCNAPTVASTRLLSAALLLVGVAMVVSTLARGGGPLRWVWCSASLLALLGAARLWLARGSDGQ